MKLRKFTEILEGLVPPHLAKEWDNIGLQIGNPSATVSRVSLALDVTPEVLREAKVFHAELILAHHPLIFRPLSSLVETSPEGALLAKLVRSRIALYVLHTNLDCVEWGTSDALARLIGLKYLEVLLPRRDPIGTMRKLVVFVPKNALAKVRRAIFAAGAGVIGNYAECSWRTLGKGSFRPGSGAKPALGRRGKFEEVEEWRLEVVLSARDVEKVVRALRQAHPYEEPAYDIYPLEGVEAGRGLGRVGVLLRPLCAGDLMAKARRVLGSKDTKLFGKVSKPIRRVAVFAGSASSLEVIDATIQRGADLLVAGELGYHGLLHAHSLGLSVITAGHRETELPILPVLKKRLEEVAHLTYKVF